MSDDLVKNVASELQDLNLKCGKDVIDTMKRSMDLCTVSDTRSYVGIGGLQAGTLALAHLLSRDGLGDLSRQDEGDLYGVCCFLVMMTSDIHTGRAEPPGPGGIMDGAIASWERHTGRKFNRNCLSKDDFLVRGSELRTQKRRQSW